MQAYVARRLIQAIPALLGVTVIIFLLMRALPGDAAVAVLARRGEGGEGVTREAVAALREQMGLNRPLHEQYLDWLQRSVRLEFGESLYTRRPVLVDITQALPVTLELASLGFLLALAIALPIGILSAVRQDSWQDYAGRIFAVGGLSVPEFWTGTMFILLPLLWFGWIPPVRLVPITQDPWGNLQQFLLPALALGIHDASNIMRLLRSSFLEVLRQDYIRTAWAKGLRERTVLVRHALKNALIPVVTLIGVRIGRLLGGTVVLEQVFNLPGMGKLVIDGVLHRDYDVVQFVVLFFALAFVFVNLTVDLLYAWLDPRIRYA